MTRAVDPEGAGWLRQVGEDARRYEELRERVSRLSVAESSRDGMIKVTVSASGVLTDLVLKERWHPVPMPELAAAILDCVRRAQARIPDLMARAIAETVGGQDPSAHLILADVRRHFPEPPPTRDRLADDELRIGAQPEPAAKEPVPRLQPRATDDGDDWDERPVLEDL